MTDAFYAILKASFQGMQEYLPTIQVKHISENRNIRTV